MCYIGGKRLHVLVMRVPHSQTDGMPDFCVLPKGFRGQAN